MLREMKWHSQFGEDLWIWQHLNPPAQGVFVEVGAYDGIASSNTLAFEEMGWTGLCIEPQPDKAKLCRQNRKCITVESAVGCGQGIGQYEKFPVNQADQGASGFGRPGQTKIVVPVVRLSYLIGSLLGVMPWLLSIDTEGNELDVWQSLLTGLDKELPRCVIMEYLTLPELPRPELLVSKLTEVGYREAHRTEANLIFYR